MHFWAGYYCLESHTVSNKIAISDNIAIVSDLGNKIPDKSWMLYLLELFNKNDIPVELNLICSFNDDGKFHAIFGGVNKYEFKIKPEIGHSYLRQIVLNESKRKIEYHLKDENSGQAESFMYDVNAFDFSISKYFTGLEWHNRVGDVPYDIRYKVKVSNLAFGINDNAIDLESVVYCPYDQLLPNDEGLGKEYPISFENFETRNGFISYEINSGKHKTGILNKFLS